MTGVATTTIAKYQQKQSIRIMLAAMLLPPMRNIIATKLAGIVAGIEVNIAFVSRQVIESMRNQLAFACAGKIVIQGFNGGLGIGMTFTRIVPINSFFLVSMLITGKPLAR